MISKNTMWKIITVTMALMAAVVLVTAVGGAVMLVGELLPAEVEQDDGADTKAPTLTADSNTVLVYTGSTLSYRKFVKISDNSDGEIKLEATKSDVNQNVPGEYSVTLVAVDASGNKSKPLTLKVIVKDKMYSEESLMTLIAQKAKSELGYTREEAKTSGKSKTQIVRDIYAYVNDPTAGKNDANIFFNDVSNTPAQKAQGGQKTRNGWETDWIEEAYRTLSMNRMEGDCYSYYAVSKAFFEYFGIENMGIQRAVSSTESGTHYWNIVKVEGGWYYFDATRLGGSFADGTKNACLITEAKLLGYKTSSGGTEFYKIDKWSGFPTISTASAS